jgi:acylphosphatase
VQVQTIRLLISGRVQGVGFRDALQREAERLGLRGWVRNRGSGEVEALVQGPAQAVAALRDWAHRGPPAARVARVECGAPSPEHARDYARFERWPGA